MFEGFQVHASECPSDAYAAPAGRRRRRCRDIGIEADWQSFGHDDAQEAAIQDDSICFESNGASVAETGW